jgi:RHS repeat-associated protein
MATHFFWDPVEDNIVQERDDTGVITAEYATEPYLYGNLISQNRGGVESQYHFDPQGSTLALTDDSQQVTDTYAYTAFGEVTEHTGSTINPFRYIGQKQYYQDEETGEYDVRQRALYAARAAWRSRDLLPDYSLSIYPSPVIDPYRYVRNNPVNRTDPSGLGPCVAQVLLIWPVGVGYGSFCGFARKAVCTAVDRPAGPPINVPIDKLDAACMQHDCCLAGRPQVINPIRQLTCNAALCAAVANPFVCVGSPSPLWCAFTAAQIAAACISVVAPTP